MWGTRQVSSAWTVLIPWTGQRTAASSSTPGMATDDDDLRCTNARWWMDGAAAYNGTPAAKSSAQQASLVPRCK